MAGFIAKSNNSSSNKDLDKMKIRQSIPNPDFLTEKLWFSLNGKMKSISMNFYNPTQKENKYPKYWTPLDWNNSVRHIS